MTEAIKLAYSHNGKAACAYVRLNDGSLLVIRRDSCHKND